MDTGSDAELARQRELLTLLLTDAPAGLSAVELEARLGDQADVAGAIEALVAAGLLVLEDDKVVPTTAATRFYELSRAWAD